MERKINNIFLTLGIVGIVLTLSVLISFTLKPNKFMAFLSPGVKRLESLVIQRIHEYEYEANITENEKEKLLYKKLISSEYAFISAYKHLVINVIQSICFGFLSIFILMTGYSASINGYLKKINKLENTT